MVAENTSLKIRPSHIFSVYFRWGCVNLTARSRSAPLSCPKPSIAAIFTSSQSPMLSSIAQVELAVQRHAMQRVATWFLASLAISIAVHIHTAQTHHTRDKRRMMSIAASCLHTRVHLGKNAVAARVLCFAFDTRLTPSRLDLSLKIPMLWGSSRENIW